MPRAVLALSLASLLFLPLTAAAQSAAVDYVIGPQDVLMITVYDQTDLSGRYAVEIDGSFTFPLVGRVKAGGLTIRGFELELARRLADGFFRNPQVTVAIEQYRSQRVFVTGEVRSPGAYTLSGEMTLIEALLRAGATTPVAASEVLVVRGGRGAGPALVGTGTEELALETIRVDLTDLQAGNALSQNIVLRDGDTVYVPKAELVYISGQVKQPGSYGIQSTTTVLQALSLAGGVLPTGAMNRTRVIRIVSGEKKELPAKLDDLVKPGDTIVVPERFF